MSVPLGCPVGSNDSLPLGVEEGIRDGFPLEKVLGQIKGSSVGSDDGCNEGSRFDGNPVNALNGIEVGCEEGNTVKRMVGNADGSVVG